MGDPVWLTIAKSYLGQQEIPGVQHNHIIVRMWEKIKAPFRDDETPWCAAFVGACLEDAGIQSTRSAAALSYAKWGRACASYVGSVVYMERHDAKGRLVGGHVGFLVGRRTDGALMILGGNQGDMVSIKPFSFNRVIGFRWPLDVLLPPVLHLPEYNDTTAVSLNEA